MKSAQADVDVLVIGAGLAGTQAALSAGAAGAKVALVSNTYLFSGLSFSHTSWGLGCVGPLSPCDDEDLIKTILRVGQECADEKLVRYFVEHIPYAITYAKSARIHFIEPEHEADTSFIPCFDHKQRAWYGIQHKRYQHALERRFHELDIIELPAFELVDICEENQRTLAEDIWDHNYVVHRSQVYWDSLRQHKDATPRFARGAVFFDKLHERFVYIHARAIVMATGGLSGLFASSFAPNATSGRSHAICLAHGLALTNIEFIQTMPVLMHNDSFYVYNEKLFAYSHIFANGKTIFPTNEHEKALMRARAKHGPFTSRLATKAVDLAILTSLQQKACTEIQADAMPNQLPEFIQLAAKAAEAHGYTLNDAHEIQYFAHASNGGVAIDLASRGLSGPLFPRPLANVFFAGEITGGMHGSDRIGGLSSANCLVFGQKAGWDAQKMADLQRRAGVLTAHARDAHASLDLEGNYDPHTSSLEFGDARLSLYANPDANALATRARAAMDRFCLIKKDKESLKKALVELTNIHAELMRAKAPTINYAEVMHTIAAQQQISAAKMLVYTMLSRNESRGSFYREDFPQKKRAYARPSVSYIENN